MSNNRDPSPPIYSNPINIIGDDETVINLDQDDEFPTPIEEEPPIYYPTPTTTTSIPTITTNNNNNAINNNNNHILSFPKYSSPNPKKQQQANKKEEEIIELDSEEEEEIDTFSTSTDNTSNNNNQNNKKRKKKPILEKQFQIELHQKRPCRDFLFFLLFLLFSFGMFLIGIYAFNQRTNRVPSSENGGKEIGLLDIFKSALSLLFGGNNGERKFNILSSVILPQRNEMLSFIYPKDYLGRTCGIDYTKDENVISLMKDINLPDDGDCKVLLNNNNNEKSEKCLEKIKNLEKFWREDLTNRKYLWIMNENFNEVKDWIIYGGVCVEQCPSGVLSNNNNNADNNNDNNKADIVENCPNSLLTEEEILIYGNARNLVTNNDTAVGVVGESINNIQNDIVGKELLLKKKVKVCGVKRIGDKEDKIFKVTNDQSYASVMGRCIPLFNNLLNTVNSLTDNNNNIVNMKSSSVTAAVTASVVSNTARDIIDINNNLDIIKNNIDTKEYILKMYSYLSLLSNYSNNWLENLMIKITTIIYNSWKVLLISFIITISITILFTLFIRFFTKFLIYSITLICSILLFLFSLLFIIKSNTIKNNEILLFTKNKLMPSIFINNNYLSNDNNVYNNLYLTIGIFLLISFVIFIFFIFFKRKEIARSIKIIQESSRMITNIPQMFTIFPIFMFFLTILFYTSWILVVYWMCVNNMSTSLVTNNNNNNYIDYYNKFKTSIYEMKNHLVTGWFGYYLFGYFWITQFILSFITILVARITSLYYFEYNQKSLFDKQLICLTKFPILKNLFFVIYYNIGSIALSSLFVGFVKYLLLVLKLLFGYNNNSKNNNSKNSNNSTFQKLNWLYSLIFENILIKGITFLFFYFLNILEKYVQFFSKNGLIQCAIFGCNFFHGSISSMKLLSKNISLIIVLEYITNIIMFILRLFISISTTLIIYLILTINNDNNAIGYKQLFMINEWLDMKYYPMDLLFILILVFLLSFIIASLFINIFQVVLDTTLQCYLIDLEMKRNGNIKNMSSSKELDDLMEEEKEYNLLESLN